MALNCKIEMISWKWVINFEDVVWNVNQTSNVVNSESILMRNGTGKTTTLQLLQRLFAGIVLDRDNGQEHDDILQRCRYKGLLSSAEIEETDVGNPMFSVAINVNGDQYTLYYIFSEDFSAARIETQGPAEYYDYYKMPDSFRSAFEDNLEFSKLIFVDTQFAGQAGKRLSKSVLDDLLKSLSNVKVLEFARKTRIPEIIQREAKKRKKTGSAKEKEEAIQQLRYCDSTMEKIQSKLDLAISNKEKFQSDLSDVKEKITKMRSQSQLKVDYEKALGAQKAARTRVLNTSKELLSALNDPQNLPEELWAPVKDYYSKLATSRIPKAIAKEYLTSVMDGGTCICGREIHSEQERCIHEKMESSMGLGILSEVYILKDQVSTSSSQTDILSLKSRLEAEEKSLETNTTTLEGLDARLDKDARGSLDELGGKNKDLETKITGLENDIEMYSSKDDGSIKTNRKKWLGRSMKANGEPAEGRGAIAECKNLYWLETIKRNLNKKLASIAGIANLSDAGEAISDVFAHVESTVLQYLQSKLKMETDRHLSKYNMQNDLRIHSLSDGMVLEDERGNTQTGFSTGEELSIIFSLVEAISSTIDLTVPMIVDNPTKGLGEDKLAAVEDSLNSFTHQLILLIYDSERRHLPNYFKEGNTDPAVMLREHEEEGSAIEGKGRYVVRYGWDVFSSYTPKGSDRIKEES